MVHPCPNGLLVVLVLSAVGSGVLGQDSGQPRNPLGSRMLGSGPADTNLLTATPSLNARLTELDKCFPSVNWFKLIRVYQVGDESKSVPEREVVQRLLQLSDEQLRQMDEVMRRRADARIANFRGLEGPYAREQDIRRIKFGVPPALARHAGLDPLEFDQLTSMFDVFSNAEQDAEWRLLEELDELLLPRQMAALVHHWWRRENLHAPFSARYLGLTAQQVQQIRKKSMEATRTQQAAKQKHSHSDSKVYLDRLIHDREYQASFYLPYAALTPKQFLLVGPVIESRWHRFRSFGQRLSELAEATSIGKKSELEVLGEMYREGVTWQAGDAEQLSLPGS